MANAVGGCNVEAPDAVSGVRSWEETVARVAAGWSRQTLLIDSGAWVIDEQTQLGIGPADPIKG